jgi:predicted nucleic acid binding AN1-type Zn finger protein
MMVKDNLGCLCMPCFKCKKKGIPIDCKYCNLGFCSRCIVLEIHGCKGIETKKENEIKELDRKLEFKPDKKFGMV